MTVGTTINTAEFLIEEGVTSLVDFWIVLDNEIRGTLSVEPEQADEMKQRLMLAGFSERDSLPVRDA